MNIMNAISGRKAKDFVFLSFWSPPASKGIDNCFLVIDRLCHIPIQQLVQLIVRISATEWQQPHLVWMKQVSPDEVERQCPRLAFERGKPFGQAKQTCRNRMLK